VLIYNPQLPGERLAVEQAQYPRKNLQNAFSALIRDAQDNASRKLPWRVSADVSESCIERYHSSLL